MRSPSGMESTDSSSGSQQPQLPPGFRFHPTDEELVVHYLKKKATSTPLPVTIIAEVDLYKFDPWELPGKANFGEQEWYFFSPRDRKYPNGARPNRAATSGYWKATGTDKPILTSGGTQKVGVKKALVFYRGKPPKGIKTNWIMHEYRLTDGSNNTSSSTTRPPHADLAAGGKTKSSLRLDDWVLCRIYKKNNNSSSSSSISNNQRPMMMERDKEADSMLVPPLPLPLPMPLHPSAISWQQPNQPGSQRSAATTNYSALLDNDETFFEGLLTAEDHGVQPSTNPMSNQLGGGPRRSKPDLTLMGTGTINAEAGCPPPERSLTTSPYWPCDAVPPPAKRSFQACNGSSSSNSTTNNNNSANNEDVGGPTSAALLHQMPQVTAISHNHYHTILGSLADGGGGGGVFRPPYHLPGLNWSS